MKKIAVKCTLSRWQPADEIHLSIYDEASKIEFLDIHIPAESLALMLTGLGHVPATAEVVGLENVGKNRIAKSITIELPLCIDGYNREAISSWIRDNSTKVLPGYTVSDYIGSRGMVVHDTASNKTVLNLTAYKYEEPE